MHAGIEGHRKQICPLSRKILRADVRIRGRLFGVESPDIQKALGDLFPIQLLLRFLRKKVLQIDKDAVSRSARLHRKPLELIVLNHDNVIAAVDARQNRLEIAD